MAAVSDSDLKVAIRKILETSDLNAVSCKKLRAQLQEKFGVDLSARKKAIDEMVMTELREQMANNEKSDSEEPPKKKAKSESDASSSEDDEVIAKKLQDEEYGSRHRKAKKVKKPRASNGTKKEGGGPKRETGYMRKCKLSDKLAAAVGSDMLARNEVVKKIYEIVKERNLLDPKNRQFAILDDQLSDIFGQKRIRMFGMIKLLKSHIG